MQADFRKLDEIIDNCSDEELDAFLRAVGVEMEADVKLSFGESPAPAGSPPGVDTGNLRASIHVERVGPLHYRLSDGVEYGVYQEMGTEHIAARPFMTPMVEHWRQRRFDQFATEYLQRRIFR